MEGVFDMTLFKKSVSVILAVIMCITMFCSCGSKKKNNSGGTESDSSEFYELNDYYDDSLQEDDDSSADDSSITDVSNTESSTNNNSSKSNGAVTSTPSGSVSNKDHTLTISIEQWHPGVLGYDVTYNMLPLLDDKLVNTNKMSYECDNSAVNFSGNTITIPSSVRESGKTLTVTATESTSGLKVQLPIECKAWQQTFNDDFDGTTLDSSKWTTFEEGSGGTISMQYRDNAVVSDGKLNLLVKKENREYNGKTYEYTQGGVCTNGRFNQTGGLFTVSMKIPKQSSLNSAFWLLPSGAYGKSFMMYDKNETSKGLSEIDIIEASYYWNNKYCIGEHFYDTLNDYSHSGRGASYVGIGADLSEQYVEYSLAWLDSGLYYYANGNLLYVDPNITLTGGANNIKTGRPAYMILTLGLYAPDNTWCGPFQFVDSDFPITLYVDYARAYK